MGGNYKSFLKKYSVCARDRIPEQWDLRRFESEHDEQCTDEADGGESELWGFTMSILFECPPLEEEGQSCGEVEDSNVDPVRGLSEHAIIGVEQHRDQGQPQQNLSQFDAPVVFLIPEEPPLDQRNEEQRPEQQLHVFPGGFVDPGKGRNQDAPARPIVKEMQNRAAEGCHRKSSRLPEN